MTPRRLLWISLVATWLLFFGWYTSFGGKLSQQEIEHYLSIVEARAPDGAQLDAVREFLESDTGDDFVIVNAIEFEHPPGRVEGVAQGATAEEILDHYMAYMWPALLRRASHPVMAGRVAADSLDVWGIEGAERWSMAGMMRYRSRRDMMDIVVDPRFADSHVYKIAAMAKTVGFPIDPWFHFGDPRLLLALGLGLAGCAISPRLSGGDEAG